jgi:hypothetical protein
MRVGPYDFPIKYDLPLRAGVRFFVCRYPKETANNKNIMGPFDVRCTEIPDYANRRQAYDITWRTGHNAGVQFVLQDDDRTAIAFMPDDIYYHNRITLADHSWIYIEGLYAMKNGMMSAADAQLEISCLREVLTCSVPIYKIVDRTGREHCYKFTLKEAEEILSEKRIKMLGRGQVARDVFPFKDCNIVTGTIRDKKPEVKELIKKYSRMPFGWTSCEEFLQGIRVDVEKLIAQRRGKSGADMGSDVGSQFKQWFAKLTPEQLQQMVAAMGANSAPVAVPQVNVAAEVQATGNSPVAETGPVMTAPTIGVEPVAQPETDMQLASTSAADFVDMDAIYTKTDLFRKNKTWLLKLATEKYRLPMTIDSPRAQIAQAVVEAQEAAATQTIR